MGEPRPMLAAARVWDAVCRHIDGMAIGSTMAALSSHGALRTLAGADRIAFGKLRAGLGANAGFLHVAIRLLADQGWAGLAGEGGTDELIITPTPPGRVVMTELAKAYESLPLATVELAERDWGLPANGIPPELRHQVLSHLNGHLIAPVMFATTERRIGLGLRPRRGFRQGCRDLTETAARILALAGWARDGQYTPDGEIALTLARQYRYPMVYLPLLRGVPELIFGDPSRALSRDDDAHLDRDLDLRFSGEVFAALCRAPLEEMALPLFDREPVAEQPSLIVDMGCGDGMLLETLYTAIVNRTRRGRHLDEHPLSVAGADPSPVARKMTSARLLAAGIPHLVMDGDIADPDGLARELAEAGHDASNALHVCKSAIHDRAYRTASPADTVPVTGTAFARPDGEAIPATLMAADLAGLFRGWRPLARRHGWIVIEAHSVPAATAAGLIGRTLATALDATHGYSCQYPVEPEVYAWAARAAGFTSRAHHEPAASSLGHTLLTIDHFVVA